MRHPTPPFLMKSTDVIHVVTVKLKIKSSSIIDVLSFFPFSLAVPLICLVRLRHSIYLWASYSSTGRPPFWHVLLISLLLQLFDLLILFFETNWNIYSLVEQLLHCDGSRSNTCQEYLTFHSISHHHSFLWRKWPMEFQIMLCGLS